MRFEPGVALQAIAIAIEACQEVQGEPQIDDGRGEAFRTSRFFAGRRLLTTRRRGTRVGAAGAVSGVSPCRLPPLQWQLSSPPRLCNIPHFCSI
jgi:hypothetical protein